MTCPICNIHIDEKYDYCRQCAWEFEYYFDELSDEERERYEYRFALYKDIYKKSISITSYSKPMKLFVKESKNITNISSLKDETLEKVIVSNDKQVITIDKLMYQNDLIQQFSWDDAHSFLEKFNLENYRDWRLPTISELEKLLIEKKSKNLKGEWHYIKEEFIENMPKESLFWTSQEKDEQNAWFVNFKSGSTNWYGKEGLGYTMYVRDVCE